MKSYFAMYYACLLINCTYEHKNRDRSIKCQLKRISIALFLAPYQLPVV